LVKAPRRQVHQVSKSVYGPIPEKRNWQDEGVGGSRSQALKPYGSCLELLQLPVASLLLAAPANFQIVIHEDTEQRAGNAGGGGQDRHIQ